MEGGRETRAARLMKVSYKRYDSPEAIAQQKDKVFAAVSAELMPKDLGTALIQSAIIHFTLNHAAECVQRGNISEANKYYDSAIEDRLRFVNYVASAQLSLEQRDSLTDKLNTHFAMVYTSLNLSSNISPDFTDKDLNNDRRELA